MSSEIAFGGMILAMIAVVVVLGMGLINMARGKDMGGQKANKLMWWRIYFQAIALVFFAVVLFMVKK